MSLVSMSLGDTSIIDTIIARGDLAHLALFLWASGMTGVLLVTLRELGSANRRFDEFVRELALFNRRHLGDDR